MDDFNDYIASPNKDKAKTIELELSISDEDLEQSSELKLPSKKTQL